MALRRITRFELVNRAWKARMLPATSYPQTRLISGTFIIKTKRKEKLKIVKVILLKNSAVYESLLIKYNIFNFKNQTECKGFEPL